MADTDTDQKSKAKRPRQERVAGAKKPARRELHPTRASRRTKTPRASKTRQRLVEATIRTIYEEGFGNTSSSEVARRIGATWSVIQYHFGSWEALLLEAVKQLSDTNYEVIRTTVIAGDTVEERLTTFSNMIFEIYGNGRYVLIGQIMLHLLANPKTHESTLDMINYAVTRHDDAVVSLLGQVSPVLVSARDLRNFVQYSLTGLAMALENSNLLYHDVPASERHPDETEQRALLTRAIALLLDSAASAEAGHDKRRSSASGSRA